MKTQLTEEEVLNNYEYKITRRILMREYPWIKDVTLNTSEDINHYSLIFINVTIDLDVLSEENDWPISSYTLAMNRRGVEYRSSHISTFFSISFDEGRALEKSLDIEMEKIHNSPAIPEHLKLPKDRRLMISLWIPQ
jgi:hypothetical protein